MMEPEPIRLARARGLPVFDTRAGDPTLVVLRNPMAPLDTFDGLLTLSWLDRVGGAWETVSAPAATRPGTHYLRNPMDPSRGTACIRPGHHRLCWGRGLHKGRQAFVQVGPIVVSRDADRDLILDPPYREHLDAAGVNGHDCADPKYLAGCIGVPVYALARVLDAFDELAAVSRFARVSLSLVEV